MSFLSGYGIMTSVIQNEWGRGQPIAFRRKHLIIEAILTIDNNLAINDMECNNCLFWHTKQYFLWSGCQAKRSSHSHRAIAKQLWLTTCLTLQIAGTQHPAAAEQNPILGAEKHKQAAKNRRRKNCTRQGSVYIFCFSKKSLNFNICQNSPGFQN